MESLGSDDEDSESEILPVESFKDELMLQIQQHQIVICVGETGSGKTTKIPQFFLDSNLLQNKMMAVTQPRRVAAITVSHRVADERNSVLGDEVGYAVRFDDKTSSRTKIKFMTDGILVRECLGNPTLAQYNAIMLDEAHERSIHTDILFGLVKQACIHRPDLKVLITSATLDITKFSKYFNDCPIVRVPGRLFPVDIYHSKIRQVMTATGPSSNAYVASAVRTVLKIHQSQEDGHILLFLTGQEEIEKACEMIRAAVSSPEHEEDDQWNEVSQKRVTRKALKLAVIPLYASLPQQSQKLVFKSVSPNVRKCVVSTNIAETSVTVPGIRYVIDPGYIKQKCYDPSR
jgi:ATP-dependent RNA helicase DHX8/PRP22